jgi:hypothetical protein
MGQHYGCPLGILINNPQALWERNNRSFEDLERSLEEILSLFYQSLCCWTSAYVHPLYISFSDFLTRFSVSR